MSHSEIQAKAPLIKWRRHWYRFRQAARKYTREFDQSRRASKRAQAAIRDLRRAGHIE